MSFIGAHGMGSVQKGGSSEPTRYWKGIAETKGVHLEVESGEK
jgi:hypothetical protein